MCSIYFNPRGGRPGIISPKGVDIDHKEFPADWFEGLEPDMYRGRKYRTEVNKYKVNAGQNQTAWEVSCCCYRTSNMSKLIPPPRGTSSSKREDFWELAHLPSACLLFWCSGEGLDKA